MAWVCETCSSNNSDNTNVCFVCGEHRSMSAIRRERRERRRRFTEQFIKHATRGIQIGATVQMIAAACLLGVAVIVLMIMQIRRGESAGILLATIRVLQYAWGNVTAVFVHNLPALLRAFLTSELIEICWQAGRVFILLLYELLAQLWQWLKAFWFSCAKVRLGEIGNALRTMAQHIIQGVTDLKNSIFAS